ncbi:dihydroorotate dehydrogenase [Novacetimonas hansenii]|uniref:dihydroorotate dehydrogenase n=1 Tax=Novacetimonas hansenii TaxID=436 RepID=UPI00094F4D35|nr:dihydroorotate dehydrogenase [Novacetimonas hansenii]
MTDMSVMIGNLRLDSPVMPASGTFGDGLGQVMDIRRLGAIVTKTITRERRAGNPLPRVAETTGGMLNAIGIPSCGVEDFINRTLPHYTQWGTPLIVSISAPDAAGFATLARAVSIAGVDAIEANISCPNIEADGKAFAMEANATTKVVTALRAATDLPLWVKLTPNCHDMSVIARAAEAAGADAVVVANTILGMSIDTRTFRPRLGNVMGGLSGAAIKPIILRQTYQCARSVAIPVIGCGGITTADDAVEYMLAGAVAVQVGTASFINSLAMTDILDGLDRFCHARSITRVAALTGALRDATSPRCCDMDA